MYNASKGTTKRPRIIIFSQHFQNLKSSFQIMSGDTVKRP